MYISKTRACVLTLCHLTYFSLLWYRDSYPFYYDIGIVILLNDLELLGSSKFSILIQLQQLFIVYNLFQWLYKHYHLVLEKSSFLRVRYLFFVAILWFLLPRSTESSFGYSFLFSSPTAAVALMELRKKQLVYVHISLLFCLTASGLFSFPLLSSPLLSSPLFFCFGIVIRGKFKY